MVKMDSISKGWIVPGARFCAHKKGMTAIVSEGDSVYLYDGRNGEPVQMLAFNPKSGQTVLTEKDGREWQWFSEGMDKQEKIKQLLDKGLLILASARCSLHPSEEKKIHDWMESLFERPGIDRRELKDGHRLIASIRKAPENKQYPERTRLHATCYFIGDYYDVCDDYPYWDDDARRIHTFTVAPDQDLGNGIWIAEKNNGKLEFTPLTGSRTYVYNEKDASVKEVPLTRGEAAWLRELLLPYPVKRFLHAHEKMQEAEEADERKRVKETMRTISRAGGSPLLMGKVAI